MNSQNNEPIFKTGTNLYMNIKTPETVFVTGRGMKQPAFLISGLILLVIGLVLTGIFSTEGYSVVFYGAILYGIANIVNYFNFQKMTISVSNLRITGRCVYHSSISIPLERVSSVQMKGDGAVWVYYTNDYGKQKTARFPSMENAEQIYNTIYSLVFPPSVTPQM